ncbi:hypothetical protein IMY05_002G0032800 [Salix suchowensis]|nr:hypothetical protein IMY05_002G0032800 [Salix suchowensis]
MNVILPQSLSTLQNAQLIETFCRTFIRICRNNLAILQWKRRLIPFYDLLFICFIIDSQISCVI